MDSVGLSDYNEKTYEFERIHHATTLREIDGDRSSLFNKEWDFVSFYFGVSVQSLNIFI